MRSLLLPALVTTLVISLAPRAPISAGAAADDGAFDVNWTRLKAGRAYTKQPTGRREMPSTDNGRAMLYGAELKVAVP